MMHPETDPTGSGLDGAAPAPTWGTSRRRFLSLTGLAMGGALIGVGATGCGTAQTGSSTGNGGSKGRPGAAGETLFVAGFQWGPPTNFNPVGATPQWPAAETSARSKLSCSMNSTDQRPASMRMWASSPPGQQTT